MYSSPSLATPVTLTLDVSNMIKGFLDPNPENSLSLTSLTALAIADSNLEDSYLANRLIKTRLEEYAEIMQKLVEPVLPEQTIEQ